MDIQIIGVPFDLDQPFVGKGRAPEALLAAGLAERLTAQGAVVRTTLVVPELPAGSTEQRLIVVLRALAQAVAAARAAHALPLVVGGDCLTSLGTLAGLGNSASTAIAWIDAHGDFNTPETTLSGYLGGMPLACAAGRGLPTLREGVGLAPVQERTIALIGVRDLDDPERALLQQTEVTVLSAMDLNQRDGSIDGARGLIASGEQLYLHVDIDVLDNTTAPGVDYPAPGGIGLPILLTLLGQLANLPNLAAVALTAVNPERDQDGKTVAAALETLEMIVSAAHGGR